MTVHDPSRRNSDPVLPFRLGGVDSLARTLHAASRRKAPYEILPAKERELLRRQAAAVHAHIVRLNVPKEKISAADPEAITRHVDKMAMAAASQSNPGGATPGLAVKSGSRRADVLERLAANGRLREDHLRAADEIRRLWCAFNRNLSTSAASFSTPFVDRTRRGRDPTDNLADAEELAYRTHYLPWAREASAAPVRARHNGPGRPASRKRAAVLPGVSALSFVLRIVCDNESPTSMETEHNLVVGRTVAPILAEWLYRYAELAGWSNNRKT